MNTTVEDVITAAMSVATDAADGKITPAALERQAVEELSALMLLAPEPGTDLATLRIEVARRVLAEGGVPADEISEWLAVQRRREIPNAHSASEAVVTLDAPEPTTGDDAPTDDASPGLAVLGGENDAVEDEPELEHAEPEPAPSRGPRGGHIAARGFGVPHGGGLRPI
ncbi:hypothetical protein QN239_10395 [Mycolicibacterium sp. Y3]